MNNNSKCKKNHHSTNHLFSPKKPKQNHFLKKNTATNINSVHKDNKFANSKVISSTPKNNEFVQYQTTPGCFNINKFTPLANSVKNCNKQLIHYTTSINVRKGQKINNSLYTIHEQMMNISNGCLNKSSNNNSTLRRTLGATQTDNTSFSNSKINQMKIIGQPVNSSENIPKMNKLAKSPKSKNKYSQTQWSTNQNSLNNLNNSQLSSNNLRKRNDKYLKTYENSSPKRYHSLYKGPDKPIKNNNKTNTTNSKKNSNFVIYNVLNKTKEKSVRDRYRDKKYIIKANSLNKNLFGSFKLSKSLKKEPSYIKNENTNIRTYNNIRENSNDIQISQTYQNSFIITKNNIHSIDTSNEHFNPKDKKKIKVNCKKNTNSYKSSMIIKKYSKYLSQNEIDELNMFSLPIYYIVPFEIRAKNNIEQTNEITSTFSYNHFPNFSGGISLPRSKSYKAFHDVYSEANNYNDEEGNYIVVPGEHIYYRYEILEMLGKGSFGEAVKCLDHKTKEIVCVKIIKSNPKYSIQAMIETKILKHIKKHDTDKESNIVNFFSQFIFRNHICLVFELLDINLYDCLKFNDYVGFDIKRIKVFAQELLFTLLFLKRQKIIHCDLKPENILLHKGRKGHVKVIDFGSSCFNKEKLYTYIQSRFYRAPEVILEQGYDISIDMWSLGCILPELFTGVPIFPGENEKDQLSYIMEYLGVPSPELISISYKKELFFDEKGQPFLTNNPDGTARLPKSKTISQFLKGTNDLFQDFVKKCLQWSPKDRMTPETALMHNWITKDMNSDALYLHKQKIKKIKIGLCQIHKINSLPISLRSIRNYYKRSSSKSNQSLSISQKKTIFFPNTPNKTPAKRTNYKDKNIKPYTTKYSSSNKKEYSMIFDSNPDIIKKKQGIIKKTYSYIETSENNCIN